jgi:hypothetical protein
LSGDEDNLADAIEWIEGYDQALPVFDEEPLEVYRQGSGGAELRGVGKVREDSLKKMAEAFRLISKSYLVELEWFATSSSNGFHTAARRYLNGLETTVFDDHYYFTSMGEAEDASWASRGDNEALARLMGRFFSALKRLGRRATLEDDACALSLAWHLCLGENVVPRLLTEEPDSVRWHSALESLKSAQGRSEVLEYGEMENVESLFREVVLEGAVLARKNGGAQQ